MILRTQRHFFKVGWGPHYAQAGMYQRFKLFFEIVVVERASEGAGLDRRRPLCWLR